MNLENQVCSLELSKRLKELGVKQDSLIYWMQIPHLIKHIIHKNGDTEITIEEYRFELGNPIDFNIEKDDTWSAFTVAELGEMLFQKNYDHLEEMGYLNIVTEMIDRTGGYYYRLTNNITDHIIDEFNEADARAKLFIILFENKLMELPK